MHASRISVAQTYTLLAKLSYLLQAAGDGALAEETSEVFGLRRPIGPLPGRKGQFPWILTVDGVVRLRFVLVVVVDLRAMKT